MLVSKSNNNENNTILVGKRMDKRPDSIQTLQRRVSELMQQVRKAGVDAEKDASKRDSLELQLTQDQHIANPVKAVDAQDEIKEKISSADHDVATAETQRKTLQKELDKAVNDLANAQLKAYDEKAAVQARIAARAALMKKAKEQQILAASKKVSKANSQKNAQVTDAGDDVASLERRVQALSGALAALKKLKASASASGAQGETYLAELGQRLILMPEVQKLLAQSLSANDLSVAEQIAKSLGQNFTANAPVDPKVMAEVLCRHFKHSYFSCPESDLRKSLRRLPSQLRSRRRASHCRPMASRRR
jgi:hypothetical protein